MREKSVMKAQDSPASDEGPARAPARKPYQKPQLRVYGDLATITKTLAATKSNDGSGHPNKHFTS
jgi:hypothetical protein